MQNWDRMVMIGVGAIVSLFTGYQGWRFWRQRRYLPVAGVALLMLAAVGVPVLLSLFFT